MSVILLPVYIKSVHKEDDFIGYVNIQEIKAILPVPDGDNSYSNIMLKDGTTIYCKETTEELKNKLRQLDTKYVIVVENRIEKEKDKSEFQGLTEYFEDIMGGLITWNKSEAFKKYMTKGQTFIHNAKRYRIITVVIKNNENITYICQEIKHDEP